MEYQISNRMAAMQPSLIREILKATADPSIIAFSAGNPAPNAFPVEEITRISSGIFEQAAISALQYSVTEGDPHLRATVKHLCRTHYGLPVRDGEDDVLILSGGQQGCDLAAKNLINEGDTVLCEDPSFIGCLNCFRSYGAKLVGVEMEDDGVNLDKLEAEMKKPGVRLFYVIPNFQNPTGITTSLEKRKAILALAEKYGVIIMEDNPYGDLRFSGDPVPSIKSMDKNGHVVYVGSFSKIIAPALRVGFAVAPVPLFGKMVVGKQCSDVHTPMLTQLICDRYLNECDLEAHLDFLRKLYREKCTLMVESIEREFASGVAHTSPEGGLFLWCTLPEGTDMMAFCRRAVEEKVAVVPGIAFLADPATPCRSFRMNFSTPSDEAIIEGVKRLGRLTKEL